MEYQIQNHNSMENPVSTGAAGTVAIILGFVGGVFKFLDHPPSETASLIGGFLVAAFIGLGSFVGQKTGGFIYQYRVKPWLKKIFRIK